MQAGDRKQWLVKACSVLLEGPAWCLPNAGAYVGTFQQPHRLNAAIAAIVFDMTHPAHSQSLYSKVYAIVTQRELIVQQTNCRVEGLLLEVCTAVCTCTFLYHSTYERSMSVLGRSVEKKVHCKSIHAVNFTARRWTVQAKPKCYIVAVHQLEYK